MMTPLPLILMIIAFWGVAQGAVTAIRRNRYSSPPRGREVLLIGLSQCTGSLAILCLAVWRAVPALIFLILTLVLRVLLGRERNKERHSNQALHGTADSRADASASVP